MNTIKWLLAVYSIVCLHNMHGYGLPALNLGQSAFLEGGPLRAVQGWYYQQYMTYYHTHRFLDGMGHHLGGVPSPEFNGLGTTLQLIYKSAGKFGMTFTLPTAVYSHVHRNPLGIRASGSGLGDFVFGPYIQWEPIMKGLQPLFVHRIEVDLSLPTGKNKDPQKNINPGSNFIFVNAYWAATLFFTQRWSASWRLNYVWCTENDKTHKKAGDAIYGNYALEYFASRRWLLGINGYFLVQTRNNTLNGIDIPQSRERVIGIGPGFAYAVAQSLSTAILGHLYVEPYARNRTQGLKLVFRFLHHF